MFVQFVIQPAGYITAIYRDVDDAWIREVLDGDMEFIALSNEAGLRLDSVGLIVDDTGRLKRKTHNAVASCLAGVDIVGTAIVFQDDEDTEDNCE